MALLGNLNVTLSGLIDRRAQVWHARSGEDYRDSYNVSN